MRWHWLWYLTAMICVAGMWLDWGWVKAWGLDGWFPLFCVVTGQLVRSRSGLPPDIFDRAFQSMKAERLAIGSILLLVFGISIWVAWLNYVEMPRSRAESIEEFKKEWKEAGRAGD